MHYLAFVVSDQHCSPSGMINPQLIPAAWASAVDILSKYNDANFSIDYEKEFPPDDSDPARYLRSEQQLFYLGQPFPRWRWYTAGGRWSGHFERIRGVPTRIDPDPYLSQPQHNVARVSDLFDSLSQTALTPKAIMLPDGSSWPDNYWTCESKPSTYQRIREGMLREMLIDYPDHVVFAVDCNF